MVNRIEPQAGQESVWDYPRPPAVRPTTRRVRVIFNGQTIADSTRAIQILETSHPPTYYIPQADLHMPSLTATPHRSFCEYKGQAHYWTLQVGERQSVNVAWSYPRPNVAYQAITDHLAFYASRVDACFVDEEQVQAQAGDFYGGWITREIVGPFKGAPGTSGW